MGEERKANVLKLDEEKRTLEKTAEETGLQMGIVQEERDAMREAMEQLWEKFSNLQSEYSHYAEAYVSISERCNEQQDALPELQERLERKELEVRRLQTNGFHTVSAAA